MLDTLKQRWPFPGRLVARSVGGAGCETYWRSSASRSRRVVRAPPQAHAGKAGDGREVLGGALLALVERHAEHVPVELDRALDVADGAKPTW
jgi:hypothetical protein